MKMSSEQSRECFVLGEYYYAFWGKLSGEIFPLHSFILIFAFFFWKFSLDFRKIIGDFLVWCVEANLLQGCGKKNESKWLEIKLFYGDSNPSCNFFVISNWTSAVFRSLENLNFDTLVENIKNSSTFQRNSQIYFLKIRKNLPTLD